MAKKQVFGSDALAAKAAARRMAKVIISTKRGGIIDGFTFKKI